MCGWKSVERHAGFAETEEAKEYGEVWGLAARRELKHYKRLVLEHGGIAGSNCNDKKPGGRESEVGPWPMNAIHFWGTSPTILPPRG